MIVAMPRDGAIIFSDLIGKLDLIRVACDKCGRDGCYGSTRLIEDDSCMDSVLTYSDGSFLARVIVS
jgi:hypothetical protein